jgi:hypothetical protein
MPQTTLQLNHPITFAQWTQLASALHARADRVSKMIHAEARRTCKAAGLDPDLLGIHPHNAMCGWHNGKPWPEVNYSLCRRTLWLIERSYEPNRIVERILARAWSRVTR